MHEYERFIPVLQIQDRRLVKTKRFVPHAYLGDPLNAVRVFNLKGVSELIITDISATKTKKLDFSYLEKICAQAYVPIAYGGGISTIEDVHKLYQIGFDKVIMGTALYNNTRLVEKIAGIYGNQSVIGSIDYLKRNNKLSLRCNGGHDEVKDIDVSSHISEIVKSGIGEIFLHDIERDGTYDGFDHETIQKISNCCSVPIIACGGAASTEDMKQALTSGASAAAAGSLFSFYGKHKAILINYAGLQ